MVLARGGEASTSQAAVRRAPSRRTELRAATLDAPPLQQQQPFRQQHGRVFNFAAGPACLPAAVLEQAQAELLNWRGSGVSVMEMSHRGKEFTSILDQAIADLRELLAIPANYQVQQRVPRQLAAAPHAAAHPSMRRCSSCRAAAPASLPLCR